ncbi:archaemetzincin family Zn-dependent metalloprotease [Aeropyrum camini]|uniref:Archaemetzincin n=1 Tax=Aeropyrum camini SY1 = JCM 12091 TaxID=1198449 RepID=U3TCA9_9CREN|nr:archaemetzincin family Zn-dependent metalloprotease [Aeropyrum camini]BAN89583.1 predicted Zn-dependent protease [Aeropyrum camini SY1 = JCM 12091]
MEDGLTFLLLPVGFQADNLTRLARRASENTPVPSVWLVSTDPLEPPVEAYDWERMQFNAVKVNEHIHSILRDYTEDGILVIGIVDADGYVDGYNFVFGLASPSLGVATVFTFRLKTGDSGVYEERLLKEVLHEAGHLLGLGHCSDRKCVMSFSRSVEEVDGKTPHFCSSCRAKLLSRYGGL